MSNDTRRNQKREQERRPEYGSYWSLRQKPQPARPMYGSRQQVPSKKGNG